MKRRAFTLVELLCAVTALGVVGVSVATLVLRGADAFARTAAAARSTQDASIALERIDRELRALPTPPATPGAPDISALSPTSLTFAGGRVLALSGTALQLTEPAGAPAVLLEGVTAFTLAAFDQNNAPLPASLSGAATASIRRLAITITCQRAGQSQTLRTRVFLRATAVEALP